MLYRNSFSRRARAAGLRDARCRPPRASSVLLLTGLAAASASAANWEIAPRVEGGYRYSDNYRLDLPGGEVDVSGLEAQAEVAFRTVDPRTNFSVTPRIISTYFPDEGDEDSTDYFLGAEFTDVTPRSRASIIADWSEEDVVRSELPFADVTTDLGQPDELGAGRIVERNRRDLYRLLPSYSYDFTQRYRMELDANYTEADYERTSATGQQDYRQYGASGGVGVLTSQRSSLMFRLVASRYDTVTDADALGGEVEWGRDFTETSRMYVRVGAQQTEPEDGESDTNFIGGVGGQWTSQRNRLLLDLTRSVNATSAGTVVERHQVRFRLEHDVSPTVAVLLGIRAFRDEAIEEISSYPTREYATAQTGVEWRWNRALSLRATYDYKWQEYDDEPSDASSNAFLISLIYEPKRPE